jgi:hypothetical protein
MSKKMGFWVFAAIVCFLNNAFAHTFDFYGHRINTSKVVVADANNLVFSQQSIAQYLNNIQVNHIINELDYYSIFLGLDDLGYLQLVKKFAALVGSNQNTQKLVTYQLLKLKGYHVILGFTKKHINVYGKTNFNIFNVIMVTRGKELFYDVYFSKSEPNQTQEELFMDDLLNPRAITINDKSAPYLNALQGKYNLHMTYEGMLYFFNGKYNKSLAQYFADLPDIEFSSVYINYGLSSIAAQSLLPQLKMALKQIPENEALRFLLEFAQEAFPYTNDKYTSRGEKFAFPEELLANPNADCEDKGFMFAYLAKELLGLKSLALVYYAQNHINVAVALNTQNKSYNFIYNNQKYVVCEPTNKGFKPGDNQFDISKASLIEW